MERTNSVITLIGGRGTGKTTFVKSLFQVYKVKSQRVLIVDTFEHPSYLDVTRIQPEDIQRFKSGQAKMFNSSIDPILWATNKMSNGLVVFEDARKYIKGQLHPAINKLIIDSKQLNLDLVFIYHTWGWVPPDLIRMSDYITVFKTSDSPEMRKQYIPGALQEATDAYNKVKADKSPYANLTIDIRS